MKRIERKSKPRKCPKCGQGPVDKILWGMPHMDSKLEELLNTGTISIGGCCLSPDYTTWECSKYHQQIWTPIPEKERIGKTLSSPTSR